MKLIHSMQPRRELAGDIFLQYYPPSAGPIHTIVESYMAPMGFDASISSPNEEYQRNVPSKDGVYATLVDSLEQMPRVAAEFGGDEHIIEFNRRQRENGISPVYDLVCAHLNAESYIVQRARSGDQEAQALLVLLAGDPQDAGFGEHVNVFGLDRFRTFEELGLTAPLRFKDDQIPFDGANRTLRRYFKRRIRHACEKMGYRGVRLDALAYLITRMLARPDGTHEPVAFDFAHDMREVADELGIFLIAEAGGERWELAPYLQNDRCHYAYDFGLAPRIIHALLTGDWSWVRDYLLNSPKIDELARWLIFLRSHDEMQLRYLPKVIREELIAKLGGKDEEYVCFDRMGLTQRLRQMVASDDALVLAIALVLLLDGKPMLFFGDPEADRGDIFANAYDPRDPSRNPRPYVPQPPRYGWGDRDPGRPFAADAMASAIMTQWGNPFSTQQRVRRFMHLRRTERVIREGRCYFDIQCNEKAGFAFAHLASENGKPGQKGDILLLAHGSGNGQMITLQGMHPWKGKRLIRLQTDGQHYYRDYQNGGFRGLKWENAAWISGDEHEIPAGPNEMVVLKVI